MNVDPSLWGSYAGTFADWEKEGVREPTTHEVVLPMFSPAAQQPTKRYRTIVADPPWPWREKLPATMFKHGGPPRGAIANYACMELLEIAALPIGEWAQDNAHCYLWTTNSHLRDSFAILEGWGFKYKTMLTWDKRPQLGMGYYFRNTSEHVLFGVHGSLKTQSRIMPTTFSAPRHRHSEKPAAFYDMVERMSPGPYLDVFARKQRFGWDTWGDEAFDFRTHGIWHKEEEAL